MKTFIVRYEIDSCVIEQTRVEAENFELAGDAVRYSREENIEIISVVEV